MMETSVRFSCELLEEMGRLGFLDEFEHRVEWLHGKIVPVYGNDLMSPINPPHDDCVDEMFDCCFDVLARGLVRVRARGAINIEEFQSQPQPDLVWMAPRRSSKVGPTPADVLLVEISDATLKKDRGAKAKLHAEACIQDYWLMNIRERCVEVRRNPQGSEFESLMVCKQGQTIYPLTF